MEKHWDLVVIGSGPAGMSAAILAAQHGLSVLVLDRQENPGGQIFRDVGKVSTEVREKLGKDYSRGYKLVQDFLQANIHFEARAFVWHLTPGAVYYTQGAKSLCVKAKEILIATGAMERPVPVPGWTLPGVMGAGAADILLKSASLSGSGPFVVCGNGPLILQTVAHLRDLKLPIAGVVLTGSTLMNVAKAIPYSFGGLFRPAYMLHGMALGMGMSFGAKLFVNAKDLSIAKNGDEYEVSFSSFGKNKKLKGAQVLLHEGVVSETRMTRLARVKHEWNSRQRYWHVQTNIWGETSVPGIHCAGDVAGVGGADAAISLGKLAALHICFALGKISADRRDRLALPFKIHSSRCTMMQLFLDSVFAPSAAMLTPADNAIVCRCEGLTAADLRYFIEKGCYSADGLKSQSRAGMGTCQGRMCSAAVIEMIAQTHNIPLTDLEPYQAQPPLSPLSLGQLASAEMPEDIL